MADRGERKECGSWEKLKMERGKICNLTQSLSQRTPQGVDFQTLASRKICWLGGGGESAGPAVLLTLCEIQNMQCIGESCDPPRTGEALELPSWTYPVPPGERSGFV